MSVPRNGKPKDKKPRKLSASQLFDRYMKSVERIRGLAMRLDKELVDSELLAAELQERFGVFVSGKGPVANPSTARGPAPTPTPTTPGTPPTTPATAPTIAQPTKDADEAAAEPEHLEGEDEPTPEGEYEPPTQSHTAEAVRITGQESRAVAKIRADSSLSPDQQEDAEALEISGGPGRLAKIQAAMGGIPAVVPSPGAVERTGTPDPGPDNAEGGPVKQGPKE